MSHPTVTRTEAIERKLSYYISDKPCRHGHVGFRRVKTYECYECSKGRNRQWHSDNPVSAFERGLRFRANNPNYFQQYNLDNPEVRKRANKKWRKAHPEKHVAEVSRYQKRHAGKINKKRRLRRKTTLAFRIRCNLATRLAMAVRNGSARKAASTVKLVGCSIAELMLYLEKRFLPGMSWDNYGLGADKWHVDHIKACANFDLADSDQQKTCFHFSNLQPLWQTDNLRKGARISA